jgi:type IV pilus assembly protein PilO
MKALLANLKAVCVGAINDLRTFNWNDLNDPNTIGVWPRPVKSLLSVLLFAVVVGAGYWFHIKSLQAEFARVAAEEGGLRTDLEAKALLAVNLEAYRQQMADMQTTFGDLLRQLPGQTEVPGLLEDITFTGLGSGLEFSTIALANEVTQEFYVELPIDIQVAGSYHDFGAFVSGVASLSRIVTLHDFAITAAENRSKLSMKITARTYRYISDEDEKAKKPASKPR